MARDHRFNSEYEHAKRRLLKQRLEPEAVVGDQPWRALKRGLRLLITKTRPLRRTTRQFLSRVFANFSEFLTFMTLDLCSALPEGLIAEITRRGT